MNLACDSIIRVTGRSTSLSFDEAFANALEQVPPSNIPDGMRRLKVVEIGGLFGGFAGFRELYVQVEARVDGTGDRLVGFLTELAVDPRRVQQLKADPDGVMKAAGLSPEDIALIKSGDAEKIREALDSRGFGEAGLCMSLGLLVER